jgi:hypothetical protein
VLSLSLSTWFLPRLFEVQPGGLSPSPTELKSLSTVNGILLWTAVTVYIAPAEPEVWANKGRHSNSRRCPHSLGAGKQPLH